MLLTGRAVPAAVTAVLVLAVAPGVPAGAVPARAAEGPDCLQVTVDTETQPVQGDNEALLALHVPEAAELVRRTGRRPGEGVTVVVADAGIGHLGEGGLPTGHVVPELQTGHGVAAAGLVAGPEQPEPRPVPVGIAPAARLLDAPFYDAPYGEGDEGARRPTADGLAAALRPVASRLTSGALPRRTVVLVPQTVGRSPALRSELRRVVRAGALVVAPAGDRPTEDDPVLGGRYAGEPRPDEDAVADVWPAAEPGVLAVGVSAPEGRGLALRNSGVDVAAPGARAVSIGLNRGRCVLATPSSHWAAAQVAGVAALVWSAHPDDTARRLRARLEATASGNGGPASPLIGHGVVQPVEAVQRRPEAGGSGMSEREVERATAPRPREDVLAETREDAVWWGLAGGAALAVLLVLRPVLARRRR